MQDHIFMHSNSSPELRTEFRALGELAIKDSYNSPHRFSFSKKTAVCLEPAFSLPGKRKAED